ncbi:hypothetical protein Fot_28527 [Forsythia ovata]|uniref:Uncharacterized protein n=1 Tax=Forsythia ovata TaxID=205694 RepID=A0ABD1TPB3_9LAMI
MAGFYFFKVLVFKIRSEGVVDEKKTTPSQLLIPCTTCVLVANVPLVLEMAVDISSTPPLEEFVPQSKSVRRLDKGEWIFVEEWEKVVSKRTMQDEDDAEDLRRVKRPRMTPPQTR